MKIRIKGNSIRYRLTKTEIDHFGRNGWLEEKTEFPDDPAFHYRLERKKGIEELQAAFSGNRISLFVPEKFASEWTTTDIIGLDSKINLGEGKELHLLIEKDFICLDHPLEDQSDNYPNPNKVCPPAKTQADQ